MPAYFDTGFSVREPMWHGDGLVLADYPTDWADAREKAGLLWEPTLAPVYAFNEGPDIEGTDGRLTWVGEFGEDARYVPGDPWGVVHPVPSHQRVVRDDTHATLGVVSDQFALVSHGVMGEILETILGLTNVKFETAGSCRGGAQVWALAYVDEPEEIAGDDTATYPYVVLLNNHDGSGACKVVGTSVRVVCWNTYQAASMQGDRTGMQYVFRHVGDVTGRIEEAKAALAGVREAQSEWRKLADELQLLNVNVDHVTTFIEQFLPAPPEGTFSKRVRNNVDSARDLFRQMYYDSPTTDGHRGTALGLVDTAVEYLDHARGYRNRDTYMGRTMFRAEPLKARAVSLVREVVGA
jgi:phage/plasmid-like protein (TIGR03299 family)